MFNKKKRTIEVDGKTIELEPKPNRFSFFKKGEKAEAQQQKGGDAQHGTQQKPLLSQVEEKTAQQITERTPKRPTRFRLYIESLGAKQKGLDVALREQGIRQSLYDFVKRMVIASITLAIVVGFSLIIVFMRIGMELPESIILGFAVGIGVFYVGLHNFLNFPKQKGLHAVKLIDRDIMFAARDMIISLRSGMPLFNAVTMVSTGYGEASKEFAKIVQKVQLGSSLGDAIDDVLETSKSASFKRLMLQASVSIKTGADIVSALQSIIDELSQERMIEMRRYGQRFNAIAMFYMLFGIIFPSMGIAVITILTTFVSIFAVTPIILDAVLVGILFLQIVFLQLIRSARPVFTM